MDKVTQSNAARAEESAAAAEELNAQAEIMKHSVAGLLKLVGSVATTKSAVPTARAEAVHESLPVTKRHAVKNGNGKGNGHTRVAPAMITTADSRGAIPMDGDFISF
jgi:hypothetical protein